MELPPTRAELRIYRNVNVKDGDIGHLLTDGNVGRVKDMGSPTSLAIKKGASGICATPSL